MYWVKNVCPLARLVSCQVQAKIMYAKSDHHCLCFYTWAWSLVDFNKFIILWTHATHALVTYCMRCCSCFITALFCALRIVLVTITQMIKKDVKVVFVGKNFAQFVCLIEPPAKTNILF